MLHESKEANNGMSVGELSYLSCSKLLTSVSTGKYEDQHVISFFRKKLKSMPCQNQVLLETLSTLLYYSCMFVNVSVVVGLCVGWVSKDI